MREIKLIKICLTDFRGQTREVEFKDGRTDIVGQNGTGKSTIYEAFLWCLRGFDSHERANYKLFDNTRAFTHENAIPAIVDVIIEADGVETHFRRQAKQHWTRKRGVAEYTKDKSDEYKFFVDGLEMSASAYKEAVANTFCMDSAKLGLGLNVRQFLTMDWKGLRRHFTDIVGKIDETEMLGDYSAIKPYLKSYKSSDRAKEYIRQQIAPLNKQSEKIDADIEASKRLLPDLTGVPEAEAKIKANKSRIDEINKEILGLKEANKPYIEKRNAELAYIRQKENEYRTAEANYTHDCQAEYLALERKLQEAENHNANIDKQRQRNEQIKANHKAEIAHCCEDIKDLLEEEERLRSQNRELKGREFVETRCPVCGQYYPDDMIAELRTKFYANIDKQREPIVERGKKIKARRIAQEERLAKLESEDIILTDSSETKIDLTPIKAEIQNFLDSKCPWQQTDAAKDAMAEIETLKANLTEIPALDSASLMQESDELVAEIVGLSEVTARKAAYEKNVADIESLKAEKSKVGVELAKWEGLLAKLIEREREWADIVRDRANKYLEHSHVEMTEISKAGDIVDTCTLSIQGVDRGVTNHASQTIIGIDISNAICKRYGVSLPLFIDDFEHFTGDDTYSGERQVITLSADKHYNKLTIL